MSEKIAFGFLFTILINSGPFILKGAINKKRLIYLSTFGLKGVYKKYSYIKLKNIGKLNK